MDAVGPAAVNVVPPASDGDDGGYATVMFCIRRATVDDLMGMHLVGLPDFYGRKNYVYHVMMWPQLNFVAEDSRGKIVGCVLAKMEEEEYWCGRVISLSILRTHNGLGLATRLLVAAERAMDDVFHAEEVYFCIRSDDPLFPVLLLNGYEPEAGARRGAEEHDMCKELYKLRRPPTTGRLVGRGSSSPPPEAGPSTPAPRRPARNRAGARASASSSSSGQRSFFAD